MKYFLITLTLVTCSSCYKTLTLEGFEKSKWESFNQECSEYRLKKTEFLLDNRNIFLRATQNEIESLLGIADEHELYERNQKFFHYRLTPHDSCVYYETTKFLSIRFSAIGKASDVHIMIRK